jgi:hypothetical protein
MFTEIQTPKLLLIKHSTVSACDLFALVELVFSVKSGWQYIFQIRLITTKVIYRDRLGWQEL